MSKYYPDEYDRLVADLKAGLEVALYETENDVSGPNWSNSTSRNDISNQNFVGVNEDLLWLDKLAVAAIRDIERVSSVPTDSGELPLLYSWYRYGRATPIGEIKPENLEPGRIGQRAPDDPYSSSYSPDYPTPEDFAIFFEHKINEMGAFEDDLYNFLKRDYSEAPSGFEDIYQSNLQTQEALFDVFSLTAGSILDDETSERIFRAHQDPMLEFERSIYRSELVNREVAEHVTNYLNELKDLLLGIQSFDGMVRHSQERLFQEFVKEYHGSVWMWVSRIASTKTVDEDKQCAVSLQDDNREFISENKSYWRAQIQNLETSLDNGGLAPSTSAYQNELDSQMNDLLSPIESSFLS
jgi:hypothetical protein